MATRRKRTTTAKKKTTSTYKKRTRRISRWRSFKHGMRNFLRKGSFTVAIGSALTLVGAGWWWVHSGKLEMMIESTTDAMLQKTADAGLSLEYIYLEGRKNADLEAVSAALGLEAGDPILGVSVDSIQERLRALNWVEEAVVERQLPDTLHIDLSERNAIAVWQHEQRLRLVDQSGQVIEQADGGEAKYRQLFLVVGEDAPAHTVPLMRMLHAEPELFEQVKAAIRVGKRRWDIHFHNGVSVKLPANNPERAWAMLAEMERQQDLLARDIRGVDLRLQDRIYIDLPPEAHSFIEGVQTARDA